jgi:2-dehydropantoate 2-reductase
VRVIVVGAGAVGSVLAAHLACAGQHIVLVARGPHLSALQAKGLEVTGRFEAHLELTALATVPAQPAPDAVLITTKSGDLAGAASEVARRIPPTLTVALQNGLGIYDRLLAALSDGGWRTPSDWASVGVNTVPATLVAPGVVRQAGDGEVVLPSENAVPHPPPGLDRLAQAMADAGVPSRRVDDFQREVWRKVLVNAAVNPVTADHGILNGKLIEDPWRGQALRLLEEARSVAVAEGAGFTAAEAEADLWRVVRATAVNRSSMLQDLDHHRSTEIDAISGELVRRGRTHGLRLPATERALERIQRRTAEASA